MQRQGNSIALFIISENNLHTKCYTTEINAGQFKFRRVGFAILWSTVFSSVFNASLVADKSPSLSNILKRKNKFNV